MNLPTRVTIRESGDTTVIDFEYGSATSGSPAPPAGEPAPSTDASQGFIPVPVAPPAATQDSTEPTNVVDPEEIAAAVAAQAPQQTQAPPFLPDPEGPAGVVATPVDAGA